MCDALSAAIVVGGATAIQGFMSAEAQRAQMEYQADVARSNALAQQYEAEQTKIEGQLEQQKVDKQKELLRREYDMQAAQNRAELSAAGVDLTTGSPLAALAGNADLFAADYAELGRQRQLVGWQAQRKVNYHEWQSKVLRSQADFYDSNAGSFGGSLLTAGISGASSGLGVYGVFGGFKAASPKVGSNWYTGNFAG